MKKVLWSLGGALALLAGCATNDATSQLLGERYILTNIDTYPVQIVSVDGVSSTLSPQRVRPGKRELLLRGPPGGAGFSEVVPFTVEVAPCTRVYIVAVKANPLDTNFTPRIDHVMPLGSSCRAPA